VGGIATLQRYVFFCYNHFFLLKKRSVKAEGRGLVSHRLIFELGDDLQPLKTKSSIWIIFTKVATAYCKIFFTFFDF